MTRTIATQSLAQYNAPKRKAAPMKTTLPTIGP